jgi:hypothetical protein
MKNSIFRRVRNGKFRVLKTSKNFGFWKIPEIRFLENPGNSVLKASGSASPVLGSASAATRRAGPPEKKEKKNFVF